MQKGKSMSTLTHQGAATQAARLNIISMHDLLQASKRASGSEDFIWWARRMAAREALIHMPDHQEAARVYREAAEKQEGKS